jgi:hypothetical protein
MTIEYILPINPKVWELWYVRLPGDIELRTATIKHITLNVVKIGYHANGHSHIKAFKRADVEFVELISQ